MTTRVWVAMYLALCSATAAFHLGCPALRLSSRHQRLYASAYMLAQDAVDQPLSTVRRSLLQVCVWLDLTVRSELYRKSHA